MSSRAPGQAYRPAGHYSSCRCMVVAICGPGFRVADRHGPSCVILCLTQSAMPTVSASKSTKVLVSGGNGYIAIWVVRKLLEHGFAVRTTVRSDDKAEHLVETFKPYGDSFEYVVVPDITKVRGHHIAQHP